MSKQNKPRKDKLTDYIIPVINLMVNKKMSHREAFKEIAPKVDRDIQTVHDRCIRGIKLKGVEDFVDLVNKNEIKEYLKNFFPDRISTINKCL